MIDSFVLYPANSLDGFTAAWAAWKHLGSRATYAALNDYQQPPAEIPPDVHLYVLGVMLSEDQLNGLLTDQRNGKYTILSNRLGLPFGRAQVIFNPSESLSVLTWKWLVDPNPPLLCHYIQRAFELERTARVGKVRQDIPHDEMGHAVLANLDAHKRTFITWDEINRRLLNNMSRFVNEGIGVLRLKSRVVADLANTVAIGYIGGQHVPIVNASCFQDAVAELLLKQHAEAAFSGVWTKNQNGIYWLLRSRGDYDVAAIAAQYGGVGNTGRAEFHEPEPEPSEQCNMRLYDLQQFCEEILVQKRVSKTLAAEYEAWKKGDRKWLRPKDDPKG